MGQPHHRAIGLELREGRFKNFACTDPAELGDEVDAHVVGGPEAGVQRIGTPRRETGHRCGIGAWLPKDHRVALHVDPAASGAACELGVLPRRDVDVCFAVELLQLLQHNTARGHVNPQRQGLRREDSFDKAVREELFHHFLEGGQHAGVMCGETPDEAVPPTPEAQDIEVVGGDFVAGFVNALGNDLLLTFSGQPEPGGSTLGHGGVTAGPRKNESDGGQETLAVQAVNDLRPAGPADRAALCGLPFLTLPVLADGGSSRRASSGRSHSSGSRNGPWQGGPD